MSNSYTDDEVKTMLEGLLKFSYRFSGTPRSVIARMRNMIAFPQQFTGESPASERATGSEGLVRAGGGAVETERSEPGETGRPQAGAPPQQGEQPDHTLGEKVREAIGHIRKAQTDQEIFCDGLSGDLHEAGIDTLPDAWMSGYQQAREEMKAELDAALLALADLTSKADTDEPK